MRAGSGPAPATASAPRQPTGTRLLQRRCACGGTPGPTGECAACRRKRRLGLQPRLRIGSAGGRHEREADRIADRVMGRDGGTRGLAPRPAITPVGSSASAYGTTPAPPEVDQALARSGSPLDPVTRSFMESRFGHDFGAVRVHRDGGAAASAHSVGALAYTVGRDVVFGAGQYRPHSPGGRRLLAHELTHVVQQGGAVPTADPGVFRAGPTGGGTDPAYGASPSGPGATTGSVGVLQRACGPEAIGAPSGCVSLGGEAFGEAYYFSTACDDFVDAAEEQALRDFAHRVGPGDRVVIHGYASEEGPATFNEHLSCRRALRARDVLVAEGVDESQIVELYQHGATPGDRQGRRSVVVQFVSGPGPTPEPEPSPDPTPEPTPEPTPTPTPTPVPPGFRWEGGCLYVCGSPLRIVSGILGMQENVVTDFVNCACLAGGIVDLFDASPYLIAFSPYIEAFDCACNILTGVQETVERGIDGGCWSPCNYSGGDVVELGTLAALVYADCASLPIGASLGALFTGLAGAGGGSAAAPGPGTVAGGAGGVALGAAVGDFVVDLAAMALQNVITQGTPFPVAQCQACARLAGAVGLEVDPSAVCSTIFPGASSAS